MERNILDRVNIIGRAGGNDESGFQNCIAVDFQRRGKTGTRAKAVTGKSRNFPRAGTNDQRAIKMIARHDITDHGRDIEIRKLRAERAGEKIAVEMQQSRGRAGGRLILIETTTVLVVGERHGQLMQIVHRAPTAHRLAQRPVAW